jgi:hypothetical protein
MTNEYVLARIKALQRELGELEKVVASQVQNRRSKTKIKGLWHGIDISEEDLKEAKRAVFKDAYKFDE